jgi:hypothetical protein
MPLAHRSSCGRPDSDRLFAPRPDVQEDLPLSTGSRLRTPSGQGAVLAVPPLREAAALLEENRRRLAVLEAPLGSFGRSWADLRRQARRDAVAAARAYLAAGGEPLSQTTLPDDAPLIVAGHQPELFHPGVWVKNFALCGLAHAHGRLPLNLVVDSDTIKSVSLRVPVPPDLTSSGVPRLQSIPFDRWNGAVPWEERGIVEPPLFESFAERTLEVLDPWGWRPLLPEFWADVRQHARRTPRLGECLTTARRRLERSWGCHNLEVPMSALCRTAAFHLFACHLLAELPRFVVVHNAALRAYRKANSLRSRNHPAPDLAEEGSWLEAPLWGWRAGTPRRQRLFARREGGRIELRAGEEPWPSLPGEPEAMIAAFGELENRGYKVRSRAFTTTLFARVLLADLFLHGIGGGKYDEVTDDLVRGFFGCEPPRFMVLSATLLLPSADREPGDLASACRQLAHECRDKHWNPQRHLGNGQPVTPELQRLAEEKAAWIARPTATSEDRRRRYQRLRELNELLRRGLEQTERECLEALAHLQRRRAAQKVLQRRDHAFCLYPESTLRPFCVQFLRPQ